MDALAALGTGGSGNALALQDVVQQLQPLQQVMASCTLLNNTCSKAGCSTPASCM